VRGVEYEIVDLALRDMQSSKNSPPWQDLLHRRHVERENRWSNFRDHQSAPGASAVRGLRVNSPSLGLVRTGFVLQKRGL
jgi:hypothetical protein